MVFLLPFRLTSPSITVEGSVGRSDMLSFNVLVAWTDLLMRCTTIYNLTRGIICLDSVPVGCALFSACSSSTSNVSLSSWDCVVNVAERFVRLVIEGVRLSDLDDWSLVWWSNVTTILVDFSFSFFSLTVIFISFWPGLDWMSVPYSMIFFISALVRFCGKSSGRSTLSWQFRRIYSSKRWRSRWPYYTVDCF